MNVRMKSPAPTSSKRDNATCTMTRRLPSPNRPSPTTPLPRSFNASFGVTPEARNAGAVPKISAVATAISAVKPSTRQSVPMSRNTVLVDVDSWRTSSPAPQRANRMANAAPQPASRRLSVSNCRINRRARCAKRQPHTHLVTACGGAREEEVRDVGARDEQHERDDPHDRQESRSITIAKVRVAARRRDKSEGLRQVLGLVVGSKVLRNGGFPDLRLYAADGGGAGIDRLFRLQPDYHAQPPIGSPIQRALLAPHQRLGSEGDRDVESPSDFDAEELRWCDPDDRVRHALDRQRLAEDVGRAVDTLTASNGS